MPTYPLYVKFSIRLLLIVLIFLLLSYGAELFIPFTIAGLLALILLPVADVLDRSISRSLSSFFCIAMAIILLTGFFYFIFLQLKSFAADLPELKLRINEKAVAVQQYITEQYDVSKKYQATWINKK